MRAVGLVAATAVQLLASASLAAAFALGGDARVDPADFVVTTFASGLDYPTSLQELEDGSLLVLVNPPDAGGNLFVSSGELHRYVDADGNGVADGPPSVLFSGLPGTATSVRKHGDLVFVSSRETDDETITLLRTGASPGDAYTSLGTIDFDFSYPSGGHRNVALAVRDTPGQPGKVDLFVSTGSQFNKTATVGTFSATGLLAGVTGADAMLADSIHKLTVDASVQPPVLSDLAAIALGVRNGAGLAFEEATGDLWFQDNGAEVVVGGPEPLNADELNRLAVGDIALPAEDFGFPGHYVEYRSGSVIGSGGVLPEIAFQPIGDPSTGDESVGAVEVVFAPPGFPSGLESGVFVGFHGDFSAAGASNTANPIVYVDLATDEHFHFVSIAEAGLGHPNGLLATQDALYVADLDGDGDVTDEASSGAIHRIGLAPASVPAFGGPLLRGLLLLVLVSLGLRLATSDRREAAVLRRDARARRRA